MAILSYPIFYYKSLIDFEMNFEKDLLKLGISSLDVIEKNIQQRSCCNNVHYTIMVTKVKRNELKA